MTFPTPLRTRALTHRSGRSISVAGRAPSSRSVSTAGRVQAPAPELLVPLNDTSEPQAVQAPPKAVTSGLLSGFNEDYFQVQNDTKTGAV